MKFASEGARVIVSDIDVAGGEGTVRLITALGGEAKFVRADVSKEADVEALVADVIATYGRLVCACENAGIEGHVVPLVNQSAADFDRVLGINAKGVFLCMKAEIPFMIKHGGGAIVNLSSVAD